jgi:hypothetical protein
VAALRKLFMALCPGWEVVSDSQSTQRYVTAYLLHSALETVLLVEVFMDDSSVDILAWGPVVLA